MSDEADEYEEVLVYAEISGLVESGESFWSNAPDHVGLLGLATDEPLLQIGEMTFRGTYEDSVGSLMFFEGHEQGAATLGILPPLLTPLAASAMASSGKTAYKHSCHTDKVLRMKRIFLQPKGTPGQDVIPAGDVVQETDDVDDAGVPRIQPEATGVSTTAQPDAADTQVAASEGSDLPMEDDCQPPAS